MRGEARKAIVSGAATEPDATMAELMRELGTTLDGFFEGEEDGVVEAEADNGRKLLIDSYANNPHRVPPLKTPDEIPADVGLAAMASMPISWLEHHDWTAILVAMIPHLARCSIEDLYLPRAHLWTCAPGVEPADAIKLANLLLIEREGGRPAPVVREAPKVGRNDPCPCGSGKKYKRRCGAARGGGAEPG